MTVTEYHGKGRCLTRVRCLLRVRRGLVWNLVLWLAFSGLMATLPMPIGLLGLLGAGGTLIGIPLALRVIRRDLANITHEAAEQAGMPAATKQLA